MSNRSKNTSKSDNLKEYSISKKKIKVNLEDINFQEKLECYLTEQNYNLLFQSSQQINSGLSYFLKGIMYEFGLKDKVTIDLKESLKQYQEGMKLLDPLCYFRMSYILSKDSEKQKFGDLIETSHTKALLYLSISQSSMDIWYTSSLFNIYGEAEKLFGTYQEGMQVCNKAINRNRSQIPQADTSKNNLQIEDQIKEKSNSQTNQQNDTMEKSSDNIVSNFETNHQLLILLNDFKYANQAYSQIKYDTLITFFEDNIANQYVGHKYLLFAFKIMSHQTHNYDKNIKQLIRLTNKAPLNILEKAFDLLQQDLLILANSNKDTDIFIKQRSIFFELYMYYRKLQVEGTKRSETIEKCIFKCTDTLYKKFEQDTKQIHRTLIIRQQSELYEKGIGCEINLEKALFIQEEELKIEKPQPYLKAFPLYQTAKLLKKIDSIGNKDKYEKMIDEALEYFTKRSKQSGLYGQFIALYYQGRIQQKFKNKQKLAVVSYENGKQLYLQNKKELVELVRTTQYEFYFVKYDKKSLQYSLSQAIESQLTLQDEDKKNNEFKYEIGNSLLTDKVLIAQKQNNIVFYDIRLLKNLEMLHKSENVTTYSGILNGTLLDDDTINDSNNFASCLSNLRKIEDEQQQQIINPQIKEKIITKQLPFLKINFFEEIFQRVQKTSKIKNKEGLIQARGYALKDISKDAFELYLIYPKLHKNLYEIVQTQHFKTFNEKLNFIVQISSSVKQLHINGQCHLNLKPSNILIDKQKSRGYICDWEFNNQKKRKQEIKAQGADIENCDENIDDDEQEYKVYSQGYAAPEQILQQFGIFASDIYSLGMILYFTFFENEKPILQVNLSEKKDFKIKLDLKDTEIQQQFNSKENCQKIIDLIEKMTIFNAKDRISIHDVQSTLKTLLKSNLPQQIIDNQQSVVLNDDNNNSIQVKKEQEQAAQYIQSKYKQKKENQIEKSKIQESNIQKDNQMQTPQTQNSAQKNENQSAQKNENQSAQKTENQSAQKTENNSAKKEEIA